MKTLFLFLSLILLLAGCRNPQADRAADSNINQHAAKHFWWHTAPTPTLYIVGDSTVHNTAPGITGWGDVISNYFDTAKISVINCAKPGRSTRTFISQGWWNQILTAAKPGDFVLIQMGHNDSSPINDTNRSRGTLPGIGDARTNILNGLTHTPETVRTYGAYLTEYISDARLHGLTPILCTPVPRLPQPGKESDTARYADWMRAIAATEFVPLVDLNRRALDRWAGKSPEELKATYFAAKDNTHFNRVGAELNAACVVDGLRALDDCPLKKFLK
jgi:rhamnogalacturonan acetylesterase